MDNTAHEWVLQGITSWGSGGQAKLQRIWESGVLVSQKRSPGTAGKLIPCAHLMAGPEGSRVGDVCLNRTFPHLFYSKSRQQKSLQQQKAKKWESIAGG